MGQRIKTLREKSSLPPESSQRTGKQTLKILLADSSAPLEAVKEEKPEPQIVLYLKDNLNPAKSNFTKYPNDIHSLISEKLNPYESVAYIWIWRISWGFGKNYCRFGQRDLLKNTSITSLRTTQRVIKGLRENKFIIAALNMTGAREATNKGSLYRICTPKEIIDGVTEEGVSLESIPFEGIACKAIAPQSSAPEGLPSGAIAGQRTTLKGDTTSARKGIPSEAIVGENPDKPNDNNDSERYRQRGYSQRGKSLKEKESIKDSLSPRDIISGFYKGISQSKISKTKRERAEESFKELQRDGFSLEDIHFAVKWIMENSKEEPYDFSIIKHTIGQAMAAKKKTEAEEAKRIEAKRIAAQEQTEEELREREAAKIEVYKESLGVEERAKLRERAEAEIRDSGQFKEDFITDYLIEAKENEIIREQIGIQKVGTVLQA